MELVGCVCSVRMAGRWWWRRRVHHLRIHKYTHTRIHISYTYIYIYTCVRTVYQCVTRTQKGQRGSSDRPLSSLDFCRRDIVVYYTCVCVVASCKDIRTYHGKILSRRTLFHYTYIATCIMFICTGSVTPILYTYVNVVLAKGRNGDYIYMSVYCPTRVTLPCVEYNVGIACQSKILYIAYYSRAYINYIL